MLVHKRNNVVQLTDDTDSVVTVPHDALGYVIESLVYEYTIDHVRRNGPTNDFDIKTKLLDMTKHAIALTVKTGDLAYDDAGNLAPNLQQD